MDASQEQTESIPSRRSNARADGFRNYLSGKRRFMAPRRPLVDRAQLLRLTAPEMTVLVGGLRVPRCECRGSKHGVFARQPGTLTNDFFVNLLDMSTQWQPAGDDVYEAATARPRRSVDRHPRRPDLRFALAAARLRGSLRSSDRKKKFVKDFVAAWTKVMTRIGSTSPDFRRKRETSGRETSRPFCFLRRSLNT